MESKYIISPKYAFDYTTSDGREFYWVHISDHPGTDEDEPEVLYTGMFFFDIQRIGLEDGAPMVIFEDDASDFNK